MEELTLWVIQHVAKMPKAHKFTLGERWTETCLDVTTLLVDASFLRDKLPLLACATRRLTTRSRNDSAEMTLRLGS